MHCRKMGGTQLPMPIAWAATFNPSLVQRAASEIADEMRAFSNWEMRQGRQPVATNCYGPHAHVVRDPRWGRLAETWGEGEAGSAALRGEPCARCELQLHLWQLPQVHAYKCQWPQSSPLHE